MIVVTGGNGQLGSTVTAALEKAGLIGNFRLSVRQAKADDPRRQRGIEIREADYDDSAALARSFDGAEQLVLISADGMDDERLRRQLSAVAAAKAAGVAHVVFTSSSTVDKSPNLSHVEVNARTEDALAGFGGQVTILRNNLYAELLLMFAGPALETGRIRLPAADGRAAMISRPDISRFIVKALGIGFERGGVHEVTGPKAYGYADLAQVLSEISGHPVVYEASTAEQALEWLRGRLPVPDFYLPLIVEAAHEFGEGWLEPTSADFANVVGEQAQPAPVVWGNILSHQHQASVSNV